MIANIETPSNRVTPSDTELLRIVDEAIQKSVFESLNEVSLRTSLEVRPGSGSSAELKSEMQQDLTARLNEMGLVVLEGDISKRPVLTLSVRLMPVPDSARYVAYYLELSLTEQIELRRPSPGLPPAKTYTFRAFGHFMNANLSRELKTAYGGLLDSLQRALEVARRAP